MCHINRGNYVISLHAFFASYGGEYFVWRRTGRPAARLYGPVLLFFIFFSLLHFSGVVTGQTNVVVVDMTYTDNLIFNSTITAYKHGFFASLEARKKSVGRLNVKVVHEYVNVTNIVSKVTQAAAIKPADLVVIFGTAHSSALTKANESLRVNNLVAFSPFADAMYLRDWNPNFYFLVGSTYDAVYALLKYAVTHLRLRRLSYMYTDGKLYGQKELVFAKKLMGYLRLEISVVFSAKKNYLSDNEFKDQWEQFAEKRPQGIIVMGSLSKNTRRFLSMVFRDDRTQKAYLFVPMNKQSFVLTVWKEAVANGTSIPRQLISTGSNPMASDTNYKCIERFQKEMSDYLRGSGRAVYSDEQHYLKNATDGEMMVAGWIAGEVFMQTLSTYDSSCNRTFYMDSLFAQRRYSIDDFVLGDYGGKIDPKARRQGAVYECNYGGNVIFLKSFEQDFRAVYLEKGKEIISLNKCSHYYTLGDPAYVVLINFFDLDAIDYLQKEVKTGTTAAIDRDAKNLFVLKTLNTKAQDAANVLMNEQKNFLTDIVLGFVTDDMLEVPGVVFVDPIFLIPRPTLFARNVFYFTPTMEQHLFVMGEYLVASGYRFAHVLCHTRPASYIFDVVRRTLDSFQITLSSAVEVDAGESVEKYLPTSGITLLIEVSAPDIEVFAKHLRKNKDSQLIMQFLPFGVYYQSLMKHFRDGDIADRMLITTNLPHWADDKEESLIIREYHKVFHNRSDWSPLSLNAFIITKLMQQIIQDMSSINATVIINHIYTKVVLTVCDISFGPFSNNESVTCTSANTFSSAACAKNYGASSIAVWSLSRVFNPTLPPLAEGINPSMVYRVHRTRGLTGPQLIGIIVGCVLGFLTLVVPVIMLMWCCRDSRDNRNAPKERTAPVTLVFTDIESSTALWAACPKDMPDTIAMHHRLIRSLIAKHNCYEVKTIGDSFMIACRSAFAAVQLVRELQQTFVRHDWGTTALDDAYRTFEKARVEEDEEGEYVPPTARLDADVYLRHWNGLRVRVGVHTGLCDIRYDPVTKGYDYYGSTSNTAARTESVANGGQVLLTRATYMALSTAERAQVNVTALGAVALRGVPQPVEIYQLDAVPGRTFAALRLEREANEHETGGESDSCSASSHCNVTLSAREMSFYHWVTDLLAPLPLSQQQRVLEMLCERWGVAVPFGKKNGSSDVCKSAISQLVVKFARVTGRKTEMQGDGQSVVLCTSHVSCATDRSALCNRVSTTFDLAGALQQRDSVRTYRYSQDSLTSSSYDTLICCQPLNLAAS